MKSILCYGDSNTYGLMPDSPDRYPRDVRWTGILQKKLGEDYYVIEEGLSGRTTLWDDPIEEHKNGKKYLLPCLDSHKPVDLVILMLGTNDLLENPDFTAADVAKRMERFLKRMMEEAGLASRKMRLRLVAPPAMQEGQWVDRPELLTESRNLGKEYKRTAARLGIAFTDASEWEIPTIYDGVHFTEEGHRIFAENMRKELNI